MTHLLSQNANGLHLSLARSEDLFATTTKSLSMKLKSIPISIFFAFATLTTSTTWAQNKCPAMGSPEATAIHYQLFAAFQSGFDGYEAPCEIKCFGKKSCQHSCQQDHGLRLLKRQVAQVGEKKGLDDCPTLVATCLKQCEGAGEACEKTCTD